MGTLRLHTKKVSNNKRLKRKPTKHLKYKRSARRWAYFSFFSFSLNGFWIYFHKQEFIKLYYDLNLNEYVNFLIKKVIEFYGQI